MLQTARTRQVLLLCAVLFVLTFGFLITHSHERIKASLHEYTRPNPVRPAAPAPPPYSVGPGSPYTDYSDYTEPKTSETWEVGSIAGSRPRSDKLHVLLPASNRDVNLCKTLLTSAMLDYPIPTLIAWGEKFDTGHLLGGGSHIAKISGVLEWLNARESSADNELVIMMDAYDIWWQLRPEVLIDRYYAINEAANARIRDRMGRAAGIEGIEQTIIFGAGKRCAPNQVHTVACYPIPESPLPEDTYGGNTDTVMGVNKFSSMRQRYLNSGYIVGPVADMRKMFERAWARTQAVKDHEDFDNGSGGSDFMYHGSDQSIFNTLLGEQEYQREVMRRRHLTEEEREAGSDVNKPVYVEGTLVDDILNPSFTHEEVPQKEGKPDEFGMGLDYFSELGHQTVNAEGDATYLTYSKAITEQLPKPRMFTCPSRVDGTLPDDVLASPDPFEEDPKGWEETPLYTNFCLDTIPVMIHHNGDKNAREHAWTHTWMQPEARRIMSGIVNATEPEGSREEKRKDKKKKKKTKETRGGAYLPDGDYVPWAEMCPFEYEHELFRDVDPLPR